MNIIVCVKQVPGTSEVEVDPVTGVLKRDGVDSKLNPYDLFALEAAFLLRDRFGGTVRTVTMGPPQAKTSLQETISMGADSAVLLTDRKFAGADVCATSYAISRGIRKMGNFDLIVCGKQTTDGDTAQVGPETAEMLGVEHVTNVCSIDAVDEKRITVTFRLDGRLQTQAMDLPCLITMDKDSNTPRLPSYQRQKALKEEQIISYTFADLEGADEARCGLKGSPTQVERIFPPEKNDDKEILNGSGAELADKLGALLAAKKFI